MPEFFSALIETLNLWKSAAAWRSERLDAFEKQELRRALGKIRFSTETIEKVKRDNDTGDRFSAIWMRDSENQVKEALRLLERYVEDHDVAHRLREVAKLIEYKKISIRRSVERAMFEDRKIEVFDHIEELNRLIDDLDITLLGPEIR